MKARVYVLLAALLFSTGGMAVKGCGLTGWQVACFRSGLAALAMWILVPAARRRWSWRTVLVGIAYGNTLLCYILANKLTTAAATIFLESTAPIYILLLAPRLLGERSRPRDLAFVVAMGLGLGLLFLDTEASATAPAPLAGDLLGAIAGVTWALTMIGLRWLERRDPAGSERDGSGGEGSAAAVVAGNAVVFLVALTPALPVAAAQPADWAWIAYLGIVQVAIAYAFLTSGLGSVPALEASLLLLLEPVFNPLWTWWLHGEVPGPWTVTGGALILVVTALKSWLDSRKA